MIVAMRSVRERVAARGRWRIHARRWPARCVIVLALGTILMTSACADPTPPLPPRPTDPTFTDEFDGTLIVGGTNAHVFTVRRIGGIEVSLTSVDPGAAVGVGVGVPSQATGICSVLQGGDTLVPGSGPQLIGTASIAGNFCVSISDVGNLVGPITYKIVVFHS
jgi:hypothetical protein